ncbi:unnamed protein product [Rhizophagus irregularis]|nr:unnamed protein product [Rhizophagus irregularis]
MTEIDIEQEHIIDIIDIEQDQPSPDGHPKMKAKYSRKKRSWTWDYFEEVDIKKQASDKREVLKSVNLLMLKEISAELFILMMVQQEML